MGGHDDSGSSEKKSIGVANNVPTFNAENMQNNMKAVYYSRTFMCIIGGVVAGILGFTGLTGFIFYFLVMAITSVGLVAKAGFSIHSCFHSWNQIIFDGILGRLMSFVLFWTILFITQKIMHRITKKTMMPIMLPMSRPSKLCGSCVPKFLHFSTAT